MGSEWFIDYFHSSIYQIVHNEKEFGTLFEMLEESRFNFRVECHSSQLQILWAFCDGTWTRTSLNLNGELNKIKHHPMSTKFGVVLC